MTDRTIQLRQGIRAPRNRPQCTIEQLYHANGQDVSVFLVQLEVIKCGKKISKNELVPMNSFCNDLKLIQPWTFKHHRLHWRRSDLWGTRGSRQLRGTIEITEDISEHLNLILR
ncbi:hypothetical protein GJAV_G00192080 [Gymnothorax javanicus]|nr:hypothetical protein GJAV_G00192080 [Gymnothorax javanicus]